MKGIVWGVIAVCIIMGILGIVYADTLQNSYSSSDNSVTFNIVNPGWYILPYNPASSCEDSVNAVWMWLPAEGKYVGSINGPLSSDDGALLVKDESLGYIQEGFSGFWFHLIKPCTFTYKFPINQNPLDQIGLSKKLAKGWNFLTVNPVFSGKSLNDLKGNCIIESAYLWNTQNQQWVTLANQTDDKNILTSEGIGGGFIVKVSDECSIGLGLDNGNPNSPPPVPNP